MTIFFIFSVSGGTLFFAAIFILLIIEGATGLAADAIVSFIDNNVVLISVILGALVIAGTYIAFTEFKRNSTASKGKEAAFAIGCFLVFAAAAYQLVQRVREPFAGNLGGVLTVYSFVVSIAVFIIYICVCGGVLAASISKQTVYPLYIWLVIALLF